MTPTVIEYKLGRLLEKGIQRENAITELFLDFVITQNEYVALICNVNQRAQIALKGIK